MAINGKSLISEILEFKPIMINSNLVCAAERKRYYWTNIPNITQPKDKGIMLKILCCRVKVLIKILVYKISINDT